MQLLKGVNEFLKLLFQYSVEIANALAENFDGDFED